MNNNMGKWDGWYAGLRKSSPQTYGDDTTYRGGAAHLAGLAVEDWGCGKGGLRPFMPPGLYRGIDGSRTPFADEIVDLTTYRSSTPGLFLRHVLEHNYDWATILDNAVASFTERMVLVLFTPLAESTREFAFSDPPGVPDISFAEWDLTSRFDGAEWEKRELATGTQYGVETVFLLVRPVTAAPISR